jgi:energy-coupling factor transport system permease protein
VILAAPPETAMDAPASRVGLAPRAWFVWSMAAVTAALVTDNPVYRLIVALSVLYVLVTWLPEGKSVRPILWAVVWAGLFAAAVNVLIGHTGTHVLVELPDAIPVLGGPITLESMAFGADVGLGLAAAIVAAAPLSMILSSHDIVDALPRPFERTGIAVATALNLVSGFGRTFTAVRDAQRMRGWRPRGIRSWNEVLVPVILTAIEDSVQLAEAMEARAYGSGPRSQYSTYVWSRTDILVVLLAFVAPAAFILARAAGATVDWYPYPSLELPHVEPVLVASCLLLTAPAFARAQGSR